MPDPSLDPLSKSCLQCGESLQGETHPVPIHTWPPPDDNQPRHAHRVCMLREVVGGIGHLIAHEYWCLQKHDPDGGLTRRQSALLVQQYINIVGLEHTLEIEDPTPTNPKEESHGDGN